MLGSKFLSSVVLVNAIELKAPKTRELIDQLKGMDLERVLIVITGEQNNLKLAARNLRNVDVCDVAHIDPVRLVAFDNVLLTVDALKKVEQHLSA